MSFPLGCTHLACVSGLWGAMVRLCGLSSALVKLSLGVLAMRGSLELDEITNSVALGIAGWPCAERAAALCLAAACDKHSLSAARSISFGGWCGCRAFVCAHARSTGLFIRSCNMSMYSQVYCGEASNGQYWLPVLAAQAKQLPKQHCSLNAKTLRITLALALFI